MERQRDELSVIDEEEKLDGRKRFKETLLMRKKSRMGKGAFQGDKTLSKLQILGQRGRV